MNTLNRGIILSIALACMVGLHVVFRYHTASFFVAPIGISLLLASIAPAPFTLIIIMAFLCELVSTLPFGTIFALFTIPFIVQWVARWPQTDFSWKFFLITLSSVLLQLIFLIVIKNVFHPFSINAIPFGIIGMQFFCTSILSFFISAMYHEFSSRV
ncbi:MAG TPA: hypothetical protein VLG69_05185 [Candidatus Andersenbacteria bacterium]|nr:hypothetical protein [Candidatus Andersenbacteria bacterium]